MVKYLFVLIYDQIKYSSASARLKKNNSGPAIFFTTNARYNQINSCIQLFGTQKIYRSRKKPEEQIAELFFILSIIESDSFLSLLRQYFTFKLKESVPYLVLPTKI